jgi:acetyl esterase/lipase
MPHGSRGERPALDDAQGWRDFVAASDAMMMQMYLHREPPVPCTIREMHEGDAKGYEVTPEGVAANDRRVYLDIHGGALIMGGGEVCKAIATRTACQIGARVVAVDYRMAPDHPYPTGLDDCLACYKALLRDHDPSEIIVGGGSAGANLVGALILRARDEGLPLPAAALLLSPEADLTESGDTFHTNDGVDAMGSLMQVNLLYAAGAPLDHPYLSPLFGDFSKGFPPTLITAGTRDLFLSNAVRFHRALRAAGVPAELHILEAAAHGFFGGGTPEEAEIDAEMRRFCNQWWAS